MDEHTAEIDALRVAGCRCPMPLLGYRIGVGPRCRLCNTVGVILPAKTKED